MQADPNHAPHPREAAWRDLDALNEVFYRHHAAAFSTTRQRAWPGWARVLAACRRGQGAERKRAHRLLDVACGNARFVDSLANLPEGAKSADERHGIDAIEIGSSWHYTGVERSLPLLNAARGRLSTTALSHRLIQANVLALPFAVAAQEPSARGFDLVIAFGLMHHIPGAAQRLHLAQGLARLVDPGGLCALSFWQFESVPGIARRALSPATLVDCGQLRAQTLDFLEPGDAFLPWGEERAAPATKAVRSVPGAEAPVRFCHSTSEAEIRSVRELAFPDAEFETVEQFHADGRTGALNAYLVVRRRP